MADNSIHIISFDVPGPPDYGGVIDVYYKLKALHKRGFNIILHCFQYGRRKDPKLADYCTQVHYYERSRKFISIFSSLPYIVSTRKSPKLLQRLLQDKHPILFEGLHSCFYLDHPGLANRMKVVRTHNIEHEYYKGLYRSTSNLFRKVYFGLESIKLKRFEHVLKMTDAIASISNGDQAYFNSEYKKAELLYAFHPFEEVKSITGKGDYFLYHGNLSVEENIRAVIYLVKEIIPHTKAKLKVAGKSPVYELQKIISSNENMELIADPEENQMNKLIQDAQGIVIPTFQETGLKLKLLSSLYQGRFVITNNAMVSNTGLAELCILANNTEDFISKINQTDKLVFSYEELQTRKNKLSRYSNENGGRILAEIIHHAQN